METKQFSLSVNLPTVDEFEERFPQYGNYARNEANFLFARIVSPDSFVFAKVATQLGLPAVSGIADICYKLVIENRTIEWRGFTKQFIGAVVCKLMEDNGYKKTGIKKSIPHPEFTKGEFYKLA
jgi:hypothetical protein